MQCGPASVKCIKEGEVYLGYDSGFIYSEVNGIRITWEVSHVNEYKIISMYSTEVGAKISTKAVNSSGRNDITLEYKYPEGIFVYTMYKVILSIYIFTKDMEIWSMSNIL